LLGIGFISLVIGASSIPQGAATASVSMVWLILAYFFHTMGELCLSPVGLSFVNKLSPVRLMALMFGVWYLANFVANFTGGIIGSYMDRISETSSLAGFFSIFVFIAFIAGIILLIINKPLKRLMHGVD
jgi:POT family proton-dependent oligopeptide transporter